MYPNKTCAWLYEQTERIGPGEMWNVEKIESRTTSKSSADKRD